MRLDAGLGRLCLSGLCAAALAGCTHIQASSPGAAHPAQPAARQPVGARADPVVALLEYAHGLSQATPAQRSHAVIGARQGVARAPGAWTDARLALAYGMPGQQHYTPDEAARYARRALDADDAHWSAAATQYLREYARLYTELTERDERVKPRLSSADTRGDTPQDKDRLIRALQARLAKAYRKLHELADIENHLSTGTSP